MTMQRYRPNFTAPDGAESMLPSGAGDYVLAAAAERVEAERDAAREQARLANIDWANALAELTATEAALAAARAEVERMRECLARVANFGCLGYGKTCDVNCPDDDEQWCATCIAFMGYTGHPRSHDPALSQPATAESGGDVGGS